MPNRMLLLDSRERWINNGFLRLFSPCSCGCLAPMLRCGGDHSFPVILPDALPLKLYASKSAMAIKKKNKKVKKSMLVYACLCSSIVVNNNKLVSFPEGPS